MHAVQAAQASLDDFDTLPPLGTDAVRFRLMCSDWFKCWLYWFMYSEDYILNGLFFCFLLRHLKLGAKTRWMSPNMKSIHRWMPLQQAQPPWSTSLRVGIVEHLFILLIMLFKKNKQKTPPTLWTVHVLPVHIFSADINHRTLEIIE